MKLTRRDFFDTAVNILYREGNTKNLSYKESIEFAINELGLTDDELKRLLSKDVDEIINKK